MQRPDEAKRRLILTVAAQLFATRPFHEVRLEDVATSAKLGKGTLYVYFASKEALYLSLVREGFAAMVEEARGNAGGVGLGVWEKLRAVVAGLIRFGMSYPDLYRVMRGAALSPDDEELQRTRAGLTALVEAILREGVAAGEIDDPRPEVTAQFVLGFVRGALLYPAPGMTAEVLEEHLMRVLRRGVGVGAAVDGEVAA